MAFGKRPAIADALEIVGWVGLGLVLLALILDRGPLVGMVPQGIFGALVMMGLSKIVELLHRNSN